MASAPALAVYLVGSKARGDSGFNKDYDVIVLLKTPLVPLFLRRLKSLSSTLTKCVGSKVEVNPLPTFRLNRAKGSLFIIKAMGEARLLAGNDLLSVANPGEPSDISIDWYFSFFFSLVKDLLLATEDINGNGESLRRLSSKIEDSLIWLTNHSAVRASAIASTYSRVIGVLSSSNVFDWFLIRDEMCNMFTELASELLSDRSDTMEDSVKALIESGKGKNVLKNLEYATLLLIRRNRLTSPRCLFSRRLIVDRYRVALILLLSAFQRTGYDEHLTRKAHSILKGCARIAKTNDIGTLWNSLRDSVLSEWGIAQPVMGL